MRGDIGIITIWGFLQHRAVVAGVLPPAVDRAHEAHAKHVVRRDHACQCGAQSCRRRRRRQIEEYRLVVVRPQRGRRTPGAEELLLNRREATDRHRTRCRRRRKPPHDRRQAAQCGMGEELTDRQWHLLRARACDHLQRQNRIATQ